MRRAWCLVCGGGVGAGVLVLGCFGGDVTAADEATRPNVLVILTDDQGRGDYSAFGTADIRTPGMDRLFSEGMTFENFRANCPVCSPTRAALLTGRYPDRVGVPGVIRTHPEDSWGYLAADAVLLPQMLKSVGYHTALVGKWHLGLTPSQSPNARGFDFFHGFLGDMMDDYWTHRRHDINYMRENEEVIDPEGHATDLFTAWACEYLEAKRDLYFVRREGGTAYGGKTIEALVRGKWKLLQDSPFAPLELYNLVADPRETRDLAGEERNVFNELSKAMRREIQLGGAVPWQPAARGNP